MADENHVEITGFMGGMSMERKKIQVVAAIICKDNLVFATQRGYGEFKGGWEWVEK